MPLIGEGNYGCVFKPYITCKNSNKNLNKNLNRNANKNTPIQKVGKIFADNLEFNNEKEIAKVISKIDPFNEFTTPLYEDCNVNTFKNSNSADDCHLINTKIQGQYYQLIYKYGGISLKEILKIPGSRSKFFILLSKLRPVLVGLEKLYKLKYIHQDIKPPNILFDTKKIYLIDFGIMTPTNEIYTSDNMYVLRYNYPYYPPEYKLFVYKTNTFNTFYKNFLENFDFIFNIGGQRADLLEKIKHILNIDIEKELYILYSKRFSNIYATDKIDIYSLGIVLFELLIWADIKDQKIIDFVKGMIEFDYTKRYTFKELIKKYDEITPYLISQL